jgi:hypothetical protein
MNMDKITQILENVVRCKYFEAGVHIKNLIKNLYQDGLRRTTKTLDHVVVVHILTNIVIKGVPPFNPVLTCASWQICNTNPIV